MRRIYTITVVSSLLQAMVCGLPFSAAGPSSFLVAASLTMVSVWLGFGYLRWLMNRNKMPSVGTALGVGAILGALSAVGFCAQWGLYALEGVVLLAGLIGAAVGLPFGLVNYVLWRRIGFIRFVHEPDDVKYQRMRDEAAAMTAGLNRSSTIHTSRISFLARAGEVLHFLA